MVHTLYKTFWVFYHQFNISSRVKYSLNRLNVFKIKLNLLVCYLCKNLGNIGKNCSKFNDIEGHIQKWLESKRRSILIEEKQMLKSKCVREKKNS